VRVTKCDVRYAVYVFRVLETERRKLDEASRVSKDE